MVHVEDAMDALGGPYEDGQPDGTFLPEGLSAVLTDVGLLPCVELHVVPQRARVGQPLGAHWTLQLGEGKGEIFEF